MMKTFLNAYVFLFIVGVVFMAAPIAAQTTDTTPPNILSVDASADQYPARLVNAAGALVDAAPRTGVSRVARVLQKCGPQEIQAYFGDVLAAECAEIDSETFYSTPDPREVGYYGVGDTIYIRVNFTENVTVTGTLDLQLRLFSSPHLFFQPAPLATLKTGEGNGLSSTLTFEYTVEQLEFDYKGIVALDFDRLSTPGTFNIADAAGNNYAKSFFGSKIQPDPALRTSSIDPSWTWNSKGLLQQYYNGNTPYVRQRQLTNFVHDLYHDDYRKGKFRVDGISPSVRITGEISADSETHDGDYLKQEVFVETLEHSVLQAASPVRVSGVKTGPFTVEIRFYNDLDEITDGDLADESRVAFAEEPVGFGADSIQVTDASGNVLAWHVSPPAFIGLDHRATRAKAYNRTTASLDFNEVGEAIVEPSFAVYKARITPALDFKGDVTIQVPAGATRDIAGNANLVSNTLTVPVDIADTIQPTVWIAGLIKNGETHTNDRRNARVNLDPSASEPVTDFAAAVTESVVQSGAFDVEFRFTNHHSETGAIAEEIGETFGAADIVLTDADGNSLAWTVAAPVSIEPAPGASPPQNSVSFSVYKARISPAFGFKGDVTIQVPAGAVQDIAGNASLASNTLTVPVDSVVGTPEIVEPPAGVYTAGDKIEVSVTYTQENLRYEGANLPYLVVYLGEQVLANARHAVWTAAEDTNSTRVTFAYTVAATDTVAETVRAPSVEIQVPEGTTLLSEQQRQSGTAAPAMGSGAAPASVPAAAPGGSPVVQETPVVPFVPFFPEEASRKAAASEVPRSPIVFNEFGNGSGAANDWLELRNVTDSAVSLKDYELSVVADGEKEDTSLVVFADVSVPANGLLLLVSTSPDKTSLAGGDDIATSAVEQKGSPHQYLVASGLALPDDGKFLLILRNAKEKLGMNEAFVDVAGGGGSDTDAFVREQTGDYDTYVWPLQVREAPGGDTEGALGSGKVWQRAKADIVGYHKDAWAEAAFTGIGYDRNVSKSAATSGTPGYPNGAVKTAAATPKGSITISEVMFDSAGGTLPQWIELYNKSKTEALNLNRWQLEFQNVDSEDLVGRPIVALTLQEKVIQPNQTLLLVAGAARASSADVFPADRVYNLLALHQRNLRIKTARDTFLSAEGFYLKLTDSNGNLVDEVGNTDGNRRTKDAPAWALPVSGEEGVRSSLIRRYDNGVARKGKEKTSWVLSANIRQVATGELHYGHAADIGTPGYRKGGALPVELSSFTVARTEASAVVVTWTTESEVDNAGFNLRRSERRDSGFTLLNAALIAGAGTTGERQTYTYTDTSAKPGVEYYYQIEEVAFDGRPETLVTRRLRGPVSPAHRQLTTFGAVKQQAK